MNYTIEIFSLGREDRATQPVCCWKAEFHNLVEVQSEYNLVEVQLEYNLCIHEKPFSFVRP